MFKNHLENIRNDLMHLEKIKPLLKIIITHGLILYIVFFIIMVFLISKKQDYHMDEIFSYGLSNHYGGITLSIEDGYRYDDPEAVYMDYMTVDPSHRFDYVNVWQNQRMDTHPPFYYVLLHTICSFFPGVYSRWFAGSINIIFSLLTLFVLRKLSLGLTENNRILTEVISIIFVLSNGIWNAVLFFRMYVMAMFFIVLLTYIYTIQLNEKQSHFEIKVFLLSVAGALTHYYNIIFIAVIAFVYAWILLHQKNHADLKRLVITELCAGTVSVIIFPWMLKHFFKSDRGREATDNLLFHPDEFIDRFKSFISIVDKQLCGSVLLYFLIWSSLILLFIIISNNRQKLNTVIYYRISLLLIPTVTFFLIVSKSAPFRTFRYIIPIYPIIICGMICMLYLFGKKCGIKAINAVLAFVSAVIIVNGFKYADLSALGSDAVSKLEKTNAYSNCDCLFIYKGKWELLGSWLEVRNYNSVTFLSQDNTDILQDLDIKNNSDLIVMVTDNCRDVNSELLDAYPDLNETETVGHYGFATTYYYH